MPQTIHRGIKALIDEANTEIETLSAADAIKAAANLQSHLSSNVSNISQRAAIAALNGPQDAALAMRDAFDRRRNER